MGKHPGLKSIFQVDVDTLSIELSVCAEFGIDPARYFEKPRDERKGMCGWFVGKYSVDAMREYDRLQKPKRKGG